MAAMKRQDPESVQGRKEFLVEVLMLTVLSQPNFVSLVGFCAQGDKRLLLYELSKVGHGLRGEATSGSTLHIQENKIKAQIGRTNVDRGGEHHASTYVPKLIDLPLGIALLAAV
ncbi:putative leucine-rich repeat receptor-like serine/threonine-protein kinase At2g19230 [Triticum aestivum]|uniref:putative leucine-rich repeat receptor-like serine/threonine-protein kinase At2g19230 n=1 Tax=Triticum aestivum TaxID=4565 RepID=UPI001D003F42|nr:putative leucine-rich repeat receptor-like serine/threonine-protein kinase At2g19230 [Triticum aestivum]